MSDTVLSNILEAISKRNPGGLGVCYRLIDHLDASEALVDFAMLKQMNVLGSDLYMLFAYCCNRDIAKVHEAITKNTAIEQLQSTLGSSFHRSQQEGE